MTDKTKQEIDIGILELDYDKPYSQLENIKDNKIRVYYQILCIIAIKPAFSVYNPENKSGVTIKDLLEGLSGMIGFWYIKLNELKINDALYYLEKEGLVKKIENEHDNKIRYITFDHLRNFATDCIQIFENLVIMRFAHLFQTIRSPKHREIRFFEILWDKKSINQEIIDFQKTLKINKEKPNYREIRKRKKELIDCMDYAVNDHIKHLENKYSELFIKYPSIANMILDICCPPFYRDEIKRIQGKNPKKDHPKVLMLGPVYDFMRFS